MKKRKQKISPPALLLPNLDMLVQLTRRLNRSGPDWKQDWSLNTDLMLFVGYKVRFRDSLAQWELGRLPDGFDAPSGLPSHPNFTDKIDDAIKLLPAGWRYGIDAERCSAVPDGEPSDSERAVWTNHKIAARGITICALKIMAGDRWPRPVNF